MNIIEIENLTYSYPAAKSPILKNISLTVEEGDFLAVVGNNGCGKSTFCKTLNGLIPHFIDGDFEGTVKVGGINTLESDVGTLACKAGYVYQDFENQIVRPTVLDDASYACLNYAMPDYIERGRRALSLCGLEGREDDYIWQLSGGQTHLLALAGAVSLRPDILILDEPIAQLDPSHADKIYGVLKELNEKHGKTIIRRHCVEASHGRSAAPGGRAAGMQHLPTPGDHCRSSDESGRQAAGGTASAHHRRRREKRFSELTVSSPCLCGTESGRNR